MSSSANTLLQVGRQRGMSLIQGVLAVLLVASLVIGIATIYAGSENTARGGRLHRDAVELADRMAEQIRRGDPHADFETRIGVTCSKTKDAIEQAVACWQEQVATQLTNGSSGIALDTSTTPAEYVITVNWSEPRTGTASYVMRVAKPSISSDKQLAASG
jgi:Tfp pilus assembly protein PilV